MAWNQVSLSFYAPRWQQQLTPTAAQTFLGTPVMVASAVPNAGAGGEKLAAEEVRQWFTARGFTPVDWGKGDVFQRGEVQGGFTEKQEIIVHIHEVAGEVTDLYARFTLTRHNPPPLLAWAELMSALCAEFGFRLGAGEAAACTEQEFIATVLRADNYQDFARAFGWFGGIPKAGASEA